jgi:hypothetical protein
VNPGRGIGEGMVVAMHMLCYPGVGGGACQVPVDKRFQLLVMTRFLGAYGGMG